MNHLWWSCFGVVHIPPDDPYYLFWINFVVVFFVVVTINSKCLLYIHRTGFFVERSTRKVTQNRADFADCTQLNESQHIWNAQFWPTQIIGSFSNHKIMSDKRPIEYLYCLSKYEEQKKNNSPNFGAHRILRKQHMSINMRRAHRKQKQKWNYQMRMNPAQ